MNQHNNLLIPVAAGELIAKITILRIKANRMQKASALAHVQEELALLEQIRTTFNSSLINHKLNALAKELQVINTQLWDVEDALRLHEASQCFDDEFIVLARSVYKLNDKRAVIKRRINETCGSTLVEEKSYGECITNLQA